MDHVAKAACILLVVLYHVVMAFPAHPAWEALNAAAADDEVRSRQRIAARARQPAAAPPPAATPNAIFSTAKAAKAPPRATAKLISTSANSLLPASWT